MILKIGRFLLLTSLLGLQSSYVPNRAVDKGFNPENEVSSSIPTAALPLLTFSNLGQRQECD